MTTTQLIHAYFDAWNQLDAKHAASFFADDAVYIDSALSKEYRGQEIEQYIHSVIHGGFDSFNVAITSEPVINDNVVFLQSSVTVTAKGQTYHLESAELIKLQAHKIILIQTYYNLDQHIITLEQNQDKYAKSGLSQEQAAEIKQRLDNLMAEQQVFKDPSIKLQDLADMLEVSRNHLSQVLNNEYQMKFFDFMNHHRLQCFIQSLHESKGQDINITELAYDAGFSSSSVFYKIFKRYQDISPGQYIKNIQSQSS